VWLEAVVAAIFFALLTFIMYAPISYNMGNIMHDRWDGLLHTWILAWDVHKLTTGLGGLWDANIFWPNHNALAYSDHLLASSILAAPFLLITSNPIFAHNAVTYVSFALGGLGMFLLARRLTGNFTAALVAGIIYAYCPWRFSQLGHESQLLTSQWLPFALLFFHRTMDERRWSDALFFGLFFGLHALSSFYLAATGGLAVGMVFMVELVRARGRLDKALWVRLTGAGLLVALMIAPTMPPYYRVARSQGLVRTIAEAESMSADPLDYFRAPPWNRLWGGITYQLENRYSPYPNENRLFLGISVLILAGLGLFSRSKRRLEREQKTYLWVAAVAFVFSLGPWLHICWHRLPVPLPYMAAYYLPGFGALRVPSRFAYVVEMGMAILAAYGMMRVSERIRSRSRKVIWVFAVPALVIAEFYSSPIPYHEVKSGDTVPRVYRWLAKQPDDFAIAEIPQLPSLIVLPREKWGDGDPLGFKYMYYSTYHWKNIINGRSGFLPHTSRHVIKSLAAFPSSATVNILRYLGVKYVVLHTGSYEWDDNFDTAGFARRVGTFLPEVERLGPDIVYEVPDPVDKERRLKWEGLEIKEVFVPVGVRPGAQFHVEICLSVVGDMPVYFFELADFGATAKVSGAHDKSKQSKRLRGLIMLDPGEKQWVAFNFTAPESEGDYEWIVNFSIRGSDEFHREIKFRQEIGDYPDSTVPDLLKAEFITLEVPQRLKAGEEFEVKAVVKNVGNTLWRARRFDTNGDFRGVITFSIYDWFDEAGNKLDPDKAPLLNYGFLQRSVPPGETAKVSLKARAPTVPGKYKIIVDMLDRKIVWFSEAGGEKIEVEIEVTPL